MDDYVERASGIVEEAEAGIQDLIGAAAKEGLYETLQLLVDLATSLSSVRMGTVSGAAPDVNRKGTQANGGKSDGPYRGKEGGGARQNLSASRTGSNPNLYPSFVRDDESLLKVGQTRQGTSTYEHRAPKTVVVGVAHRVVSVARKAGRPFKASALSNVHGHEDGKRIPGYQIYLCLAWLKREGLIKQRGRQGYMVPELDSFISGVEQAWEQLPDNVA